MRDQWRAARATIRGIKERSGLNNRELAEALGMELSTLERHLHRGPISSSRARYYDAIKLIEATDTAVHLVIARERKRPGPKPGGVDKSGEQRNP